MVQPQGTQHFLDGVEAVVRGQVKEGVEAQMCGYVCKNVPCSIYMFKRCLFAPK